MVWQRAQSKEYARFYEAAESLESDLQKRAARLQLAGLEERCIAEELSLPIGAARAVLTAAKRHMGDYLRRKETYQDSRYQRSPQRSDRTPRYHPKLPTPVERYVMAQRNLTSEEIAGRLGCTVETVNAAYASIGHNLTRICKGE